MAHTQGPWALDGDINAMNLDVVSGEGRIAMMDCDNFELPNDEVAANARLIAAAPDMLKAIVEVLAAWDMEQDTPEHNQRDRLAAAIEALREMLREADA